MYKAKDLADYSTIHHRIVRNIIDHITGICYAAAQQGGASAIYTWQRGVDPEVMEEVKTRLRKLGHKLGDAADNGMIISWRTPRG